jgi:hypothetical protein
MKALVPKNGNDDVQTPDLWALEIVKHFCPQIQGIVLEPCAGDGVFVRAFRAVGIPQENIRTCEIKEGRDFFDFHEHVDWIITNPPWSLIRKFSQHAYTVADNHVWLANINHYVGLEARLRDMRKAGFGIKEILICAAPKAPWPSSGFQLGILHVQKGYSGPVSHEILNLLQLVGQTPDVERLKRELADLAKKMGHQADGEVTSKLK